MKQYRADIDGMRCIAVVSVILYHSHLTISGYSLFTGGFIGVDIFFVISGYLITGNIQTSIENQRFSIAQFYEKRVRRILPALYFMMVLTIIPASVYMFPKAFIHYSQSIMSTILFYSNFFFWDTKDYFAQSNLLEPLLHTWSLSIEEQFYFLIPPIMLMTIKRKLKINQVFVILLLLSLAYCIYNSGENAFYDPISRSWELLSGALLALNKEKLTSINKPINFLSNISLPILIYIILTFDHKTLHPGLITILPILCTLFIIANTANNTTTRVLTFQPLVFIGLISYSLYLYHQPFFAFLEVYTNNNSSSAQRIMAIFLVFPVSYLSWHYIEKPFRNSKNITNRTLYTLLVSITCLLMIVVYYINRMHGLPNRLPPEALRITTVSSFARILKQEGTICFDRSPKEACILPDKKAKPTWYFLGDSHSEVIASGLVPKLLKDGESVKIFTLSGCSFIPGFTRYSVHGVPNDCGKRNQYILNELLNASPANILISYRAATAFQNSFFDNRLGGVEKGPYNFNFIGQQIKTESERVSKLKQSIVSSISSLIKHGHQVILVYPIPEVGWNVPEEMLKRRVWENNNKVATSYNVYLERNKEVIKSFDALGSSGFLKRVYPDHIFCSKITDTCITHTSSEIFYSDSNHLSEAGVNRIIQLIKEE